MTQTTTSFPGRIAAARCARIAAMLSGIAAAAPAWSSQEAGPAGMPVLRCEVRYMSDTATLEFEPGSRPYDAVAHDIGGRFRFKAVVAGDARRVDHIALYAYDMSVPRAPVLIHQVVHKPPFATDLPVPGLTGWNHVYSARLGREMVYGCALRTRALP
jgi:hypothetical protein